MREKKERFLEVTWVFRAEIKSIIPVEEYHRLNPYGEIEGKMWDWQQKSRLEGEIRDLAFNNKLSDKIYRHERWVEK